MISYDCYVWDEDEQDSVYCGTVELDETEELEVGDVVETDEGFFTVICVNEDEDGNLTIDVEEA